MKPLLMIAYQFPPFAGSSAVQRALRFVQHLPALGWQPIVLSAHPRAYEATSDDLLREVPQEAIVARAAAFDAARHLSLFGRYPTFLARPDRWVSWKWDAVRTGMRLIRQHRPAAIWSTFPIATAHLVAATLQRRSGLPWIADFRDPMAQEGYPTDPTIWQSYKRIEEAAARNAARCVFVTPSAVRMYRTRYADIDASRFVMIENGYDEESFAAVEAAAARQGPLRAGAITLVHSGIVYPSERDPTQFFEALRQLKGEGVVRADRLKIRFRAAMHEDLLHRLAASHGIADLIEVMPPVPYREALAEMLRADGLIVMQNANCNEQIPAKLYEYLRARRPVLGLTDPAGDTADLLRRAGLDAIARLESAAEIAPTLTRLLADLRAGTAAQPDADCVMRASRRSRSQDFAAVLDEAIAP
jgi:glycosyltransferase involved in cell wall biosynthesis